MADTAHEEPVPLHLPAILQNPTNPSLRQVAAHNAQQREKALARREQAKHQSSSSSADAYAGRGKRFVRRKDNASFAFNPHVSQPTRADFTPPIPLHHRRIKPIFPPSAVSSVPRSVAVPNAEMPVKDPFSPDSRSGAFSTSLKGTRALLRKKGRRAEVLVGVVEGRIREWLGAGGSDTLEPPNQTVDDWTIVEPTLVEYSGIRTEDPSSSATIPTHTSTSASVSASRRMPAQHQIQDRLPPLPIEHGQLPALLELSRSPAHLSWAINDGYDRLVVHLVVRYYELISWSEDHLTANGQKVRLTHIVLPSLAKPKIPSSHALLTPETSDISDLSAPSSSDLSDVDRHTGYDTDGTTSEAGTEMGYALEPEGSDAGDGDISHQTITMHEVTRDIASLDLRRTHSNTSSMYASSEGSTDYGMGDSLTLPPASAPPPPNGTGGWTMVMSDTETNSDIGDVDFPAPVAGVTRTTFGSVGNVSNVGHLGRVGARGWEERPTFFEYLYGE